MPKVELHALHTFPEVSYATWRQQVERGLQGGDIARLSTRTLEGIEVAPLYTADDWPWAQDAGGFAGAPPYRRGGEPLGRHAARWDMRPHYDNPDPSALAREIADDLGRGARSLWLCFDRQVRGGQARPEPPAGPRERGVPCLSATQLGQLLQNVPLQEVTLSLDAGANGLPVAACFVHALQARGLRPEQTRAWLNLDPLGALARDGALPYTLEVASQQLCALARFAVQHSPRWRSATVSVVPYHDAGAHAAQELAYALATAVQYLRWLTEAGLSLPQASAQVAFSVAVGSDFFMEIAKLRALRQCWAGVIAACGGDAEAQRCALHALCSSRTKSARDPWVNLLRETTEAFAAAAGGADAITSGGFDRAVGLSDAFARRIAGNAQVILDQEAHVTEVADPAGGAWYVEQLSDGLAERAWALFQALEAEGGMAAALLAGSVGAQIAEVAQARAARVATRKAPITGVSEFANVDERPLVRPEPDWQAIAGARRGTLEAGSRDEAVAAPLLRAAASGGELVAAAVLVAAAGANLGQLSCALAGPGEPARARALPPRRPAEPYEQLRDACDAHARAHGKRPSVFSCNLGPISEHKARAQFAAGFLAAGGLSVIDNDGFETPEAAAEGYARSGAELVVICGSDDAYARALPALGPLLRARGARRVIVAGKPGEQAQAFGAAGVTDYIYLGCDVVQALRALLAAIGVTP